MKGSLDVTALDEAGFETYVALCSMCLARAPELISVGEVVRRMEPNFDIVECFSASNQPCTVVSVCALKEVLYRAGNEFLAVLDKYTVADATQQNAFTEQLFSVDQLISSSPQNTN